MPIEKLDAHPSVIVVHNPSTGKLLFSVYDQGYPRAAYRGAANNIGGNPEEGDVSPEGVLIKEITEEFDPNHDELKKYVGEVKWASDREIRLVRNGLLGNIAPLQDFLVRQQEPIPGGNKPYQAIYSAFIASVPREVIECVERNLSDGLNITTEGLVGVYSLDQLTSSPRGEFSTAHATAPILNYVFKANVPYPKQISAQSIGTPKRSFHDYLTDFEYNNEKLAKAARAQD